MGACAGCCASKNQQDQVAEHPMKLGSRVMPIDFQG